MKYMLLIYAGETAITESERQRCYEESTRLCHDLAADGHFLSANPLQPVSTATSVRVRDGRRTVTDGPFAETREQLGGYFLVDAKDLDEAIAIANASEYGNAATIYTQNGKHARQFQLGIQAGMVGVNIGVAAPMALFPFGGQKNSFFGDTKAHGGTGVDFYTERKIVITRWF